LLGRLHDAPDLWVLAHLGVRKGDAQAVKTLTQLSGTVQRYLKANSPVILTVSAGVGVLTTSYLVGRASFKAAEVIRKDEEKYGTHGERLGRLKERTKLVWRLYIPAVISGTSTIVCIVGANRAGTAKTMAAQTALTVTERAYSEYRDKVIEEFGERKDKAIRDSVAADRVKADGEKTNVLVSGPGNVLCCELHTGRYFLSDMETLRRAQNDINAKILSHDYATLYDFYYIVGLKATTTCSDLGWTAPKQLELSFSTQLTEDNRPCITFEYNYVKPL
jgi:hypothetical protein